MSELLTERATHCSACESELVNELCMNPECPEAQAVATAGATRETAKAAAATGSSTGPAAETQPRSFARQGYAD